MSHPNPRVRAVRIGVILTCFLSPLMSLRSASASLWTFWDDSYLAAPRLDATIRANAATKGLWEGRRDNDGNGVVDSLDLPGPRLFVSPIHSCLAIRGGSRGKIVMWRDAGQDYRAGNPPLLYAPGFEVFDLFDSLATDTFALVRSLSAADSLTKHNPGCAGMTFLPDGRLFLAGGRYANQRYCSGSLNFGDCGCASVSSPPEDQESCQCSSHPATCDHELASLCCFNCRKSRAWAALYNPTVTGSGSVQRITPWADSALYYPTCILTPDGDPLVAGGDFWRNDLYDDPFAPIYPKDCAVATPDGAFPSDPGDERQWVTKWFKWNRATGVWSVARDPSYDSHWYPMLFFFPNAELFWSGGYSTLGGSPIYDSMLMTNYTAPGSGETFFTRAVPQLDRYLGNAVRLTIPPVLHDPPDSTESRVLIFSGFKAGTDDQTWEIFDRKAVGGTPGSWTQGSGLLGERNRGNAVLLPDGTVFAAGGVNGGLTGPCAPGLDNERQRLTKIYHDSPRAGYGSWIDGDSLTVGRMYHSSAVLLPDARVFITGNDRDAGCPKGYTYDVYYPPYLFTGSGEATIFAPRPHILDPTPSTIDSLWWGYQHTLQYAHDDTTVRFNGLDAEHDRVVLVRPGASTHSRDFDQRVINLQVTSWSNIARTVTVREPASNNWGPLGYYMMFLLIDGVPSEAWFVRLVPNGPGGGGCPYLFTWDGIEYNRDNNLLPNSEFTEADSGYFIDHYKLMQPVATAPDGFRFEVREEESSHSFLDEMTLLRVDHPGEVSVCVAPDGRVVKYAESLPARSVDDRNGRDFTADLATRDGTKTQFDSGDALTFTFDAPPWLERGPIPRGTPLDLLLVVDEKQTCQDPPCPGSIIVQLRDPEMRGGWRDVTTVHPRALWEEYVVSLAGGVSAITDSLEVRLLWTNLHSIDYAALVVPSEAAVETAGLPLVAATHLSGESVLGELSAADHRFAELLPGESISVRFARAPAPPPGTIRDFFLTTTGYYADLSSPRGARRVPAGGSPGHVAAGPNPFRQGTRTRIAFTLPEAEPVTVRVFDVAGRLVRTLWDGMMAAGAQTLHWDGTDEGRLVRAPGVYFAEVRAEGMRQAQKIVMTR